MPEEPQRPAPDTNGVRTEPPVLGGLSHFEPPAPEGIETPRLAPVKDPPWSGFDVVLVFATFIAFAALIVPVVLFSILRVKLGAQMNVETVANDGRFAVVTYVLASIPTLMLMWYLASRGPQRATRALRLALPGQRRWTWVAAGVFVGVAAATAEVVLPIPKDLPITKLFSTAVSAWSIAFLGVFVAPFVEELLFRGFMYPAVARAAGRNAAIAITGFAFALLHAGQLGFSWAALLVMFGVGVAFTVVRVVADSVGASILTHFIYNTVQVVIAVIASRGFRNLPH